MEPQETRSNESRSEQDSPGSSIFRLRVLGPQHWSALQDQLESMQEAFQQLRQHILCLQQRLNNTGQRLQTNLAREKSRQYEMSLLAIRSQDPRRRRG